MILNTLKIIGVAIGVMAVVLAIGYLYVMNEMREEIKKDRGVRMENVFGYIVGAWFVASVWLTGAAVVSWLAWNVSRMVIKKPRVRGN
jgi:hypothetical protein